MALAALLPFTANAQQASRSTWDAADFRIWGYIPYWSGEAGTSVVDQLNLMSSTGMYDHVSDIIYFGGPRPTSTGGLAYHSTAVSSMTALKNLSAQHGFDLHLSMFDVSGGTVDAVWTSIVSNPTYRQNFVNNVNALLQTYEMDGFNFDWERPNTTAKWGNYTQLARELGDVIRPQGKEVSVCDYGFTSAQWDDSPLFDARVYDQLFIMGYHYPAFSGDSLNNNNFANGKLNTDDQGPEKAFTNEQLTIGIGTYGAEGPATASLRSIVNTHPDLPYNASSVTATPADPIVDINGNSRTSGTWNIESREQVREKTKLALDRNMAGTFSWTLHYDARNDLSLHRVMHQYVACYRDAPDLDLDGKVDVSDATTLANNMGLVTTATGTTTAAQFDAYYLAGNWEKGDRDGDGFVNQADADWLAGRYTALGITLPDRLAYSGTFESFHNSKGLAGRWQAARNLQNKLIETSNFKQEATNFLSWNGTGAGASQRSNNFVTMRNQSSAEALVLVNTASRSMQADLSAPINMGEDGEAYFTFLVREITGPLTPAQLASNNRNLSLQFLNGAGATQFSLSLRGSQNRLFLESVSDAAGDNVSTDGFASDTTYMVVGKISGNGAAANTMQASIFANNSVVANFTDPGFEWMLTAMSSSDFNPIITDLRFLSTYQSNFTVSNIWIGDAAALIPPTLTSQGDFNQDGMVDSADYIVWRRSVGQTGANLPADGNGDLTVTDGDVATWRANFGKLVTAAGAGLDGGALVPEPASGSLFLAAGLFGYLARRRR